MPNFTQFDAQPTLSQNFYLYQRFKHFTYVRILHIQRIRFLTIENLSKLPDINVKNYLRRLTL